MAGQIGCEYRRFYALETEELSVNKFVALLLVSLLAGCAKFPKYQTPFSVEDPSIKGENSFASGTMIGSTRQRYWMSYRHALTKGGYTVSNKTDFPFFTITDFSAPAEDKDANFQLWKEGQAYARSLCSDFFRRISLAKAHRDHAQKQTNIAGGLITAAMGLASASPEAVGASGLVFSSAESSFDAYNAAYLVTPDLGLMEALVRAVQNDLSSKVAKNDMPHVSDAIGKLNEYVYPCTFTGMQALLDDSLDKKITEFGYEPFTK